MDEVANFLGQCELQKYIDIFEEKGYDSMNYFMSLSPTKIREHTASMKMKEGHAERFLQAIAKRKKTFVPPVLLSKDIFTAPRTKDRNTKAAFRLPDKLYSSQSVTAATRKHSTSLRCRTMLCPKKCGRTSKIFRCATVVKQLKMGIAPGPLDMQCPYNVVWRRKEAAAFCTAKYEWNLDRDNSILHHKPLCGSGNFNT